MTLPNPTLKQNRMPAKLNATLDKHLLAYTVAASAAGVGLLASPAQVEAKIIYTKANIPINVDSGSVSLDLNNDGIPDFKFYNAYTIGGRARRAEGTHGGTMVVYPAQASNAIREKIINGFAFAAALKNGVKVGDKDLAAQALVMADSGGNYTGGGGSSGPWLGVTARNLGLKFAINGKMHYGWARIKWGGIGNTDYIIGYAYETIPNKPIITGDKKGADGAARGLGELARGAAGTSGGNK